MKSKACLSFFAGHGIKGKFKVCAGQTFNIESPSGWVDKAKIVSYAGKGYKIKSMSTGKARTISENKLMDAIESDYENREKFRVRKEN
jgi:hypothetical protein